MSFRAVPTDWSEWRGALRRLAIAINQLGDGRSNGFGSVTLTANQATTVVTDRRVGTDTTITFMPETANAAAEMDGMYVGTVTAGSFTITHANNAQTDRDFRYMLQG